VSPWGDKEGEEATSSMADRSFSARNLIAHFFDCIDDLVEGYSRFVEAQADGASRDIDLDRVDARKLADSLFDRHLAVVAGDPGHGKCSGSHVWFLSVPARPGDCRRELHRLHQLVDDLRSPSFFDGVDHAGLQVVLQENPVHLLQRGLQGRNLLHDLGAVAVVLDHRYDGIEVSPDRLEAITSRGLVDILHDYTSYPTRGGVASERIEAIRWENEEAPAEGAPGPRLLGARSVGGGGENLTQRR